MKYITILKGFLSSARNDDWNSAFMILEWTTMKDFHSCSLNESKEKLNGWNGKRPSRNRHHTGNTEQIFGALFHNRQFDDNPTTRISYAYRLSITTNLKNNSLIMSAILLRPACGKPFRTNSVEIFRIFQDNSTMQRTTMTVPNTLLRPVQQFKVTNPGYTTRSIRQPNLPNATATPFAAMQERLHEN